MARRADPQRGIVSRGRIAGLGREKGGRSSSRSGGSGGGRGRALVFVVAVSILVLAGMLTVARPVFNGVVRGLAEANPAAMQVPFVADVMRAELGDRVTRPASPERTRVRFRVRPGASASEIAAELEAQRLLTDRLAFEYLVVTGDVGGRIQSGTYELSRNMSPQQIVERLQDPPEQTATVALREGLRLEQITAYLATLGLEMDVADFYRLATNPPAALRRDYSFLATLPRGRSLEGYLGSGTFEVYTNVTAEELVRLLLDQWERQVGDDPIAAARASGKDFYEVLTLASIVEREAALPEEQPIIAGVFQNRLNRGMLLNADPTVYYALDTVALRGVDLSRWPTYTFWKPIGRPLNQVRLPAELEGYQTYRRRGLIPGPICTPTASSIRAALRPNTAHGYLYFVAIPDGSKAHAFARTLEEHQANLKKYGYT